MLKYTNINGKHITLCNDNQQDQLNSKRLADLNTRPYLDVF